MEVYTRFLLLTHYLFNNDMKIGYNYLVYSSDVASTRVYRRKSVKFVTSRTPTIVRRYKYACI